MADPGMESRMPPAFPAREVVGEGVAQAGGVGEDRGAERAQARSRIGGELDGEEVGLAGTGRVQRAGAGPDRVVEGAASWCAATYGSRRC
jgi:hypothetical protein